MPAGPTPAPPTAPVGASEEEKKKVEEWDGDEHAEFFAFRGRTSLFGWVSRHMNMSFAGKPVGWLGFKAYEHVF